MTNVLAPRCVTTKSPSFVVPVGNSIGFHNALDLYHFFAVEWHLSHRGVRAIWEILREANAISPKQISIRRFKCVCGGWNREIWSEQDQETRADPYDPLFGCLNRDIFNIICDQLELPRLIWRF